MSVFDWLEISDWLEIWFIDSKETCFCKTLSLILFFVFKNQTWWNLANDLQMRKTDDERRIIWRIRIWRICILIQKWRRLLSLQNNKHSKTQQCDNPRNLNACRWRRLCQTRWWIRRQHLLFIESILHQTKDETENEIKSETNQNDH